MEKSLNYQFNRRSEGFFDWLGSVIHSEKFYEADAIIIMKDISNSYLPKSKTG